MSLEDHFTTQKPPAQNVKHFNMSSEAVRRKEEAGQTSHMNWRKRAKLYLT